MITIILCFMGAWFAYSVARGRIRFTAYMHRTLLLITPSLSHMQHACDNPECRSCHGWSMELGWLFWSIGFDHIP